MFSIPGRVPISISPFFWLLIIILGWLNSGSILGTAIWASVIFISILFHEYGHALTALLFGQEAEINLVGLGGLTKRSGPKLVRWKEFLIVLNGPIAGFVLFFIAYYLLMHTGEKNKILLYALQVALNVNLFWTLLNLLPIIPLDGGHLMRILLEAAFGTRGFKITFLISMIIGGLAGLYFFLIQQVLMGALFFMLTFESYRTWTDVKNMTYEDDDEKLQNLVNEGLKELKKGDAQSALDKFSYIRQQVSKGSLYVTATQYGAHILAEQGQLTKAYAWLFPLKNRLSPDYMNLLHVLAYQTQEWEEAIKIGEQAYQNDPSVHTAKINALCYAILGKATPAVGWLHCAIQQGLADVQKFIEKREFDAIRDSKIFQDLVKETLKTH